MSNSDGDPLVLLVEDNERNARLFSEILGANEFRVVVARDGYQCLDSAADLQPALILMDLQLPGMDGIAVIRHLKQDPATQNIPIIAVTAHAMPEHRERFMAAGCRSYITKPISYHPFLNEIRSVLAERGTMHTPEVLHAKS
jgi:two-component system cell cycle response regulator DivK